jgi:hypothetical protein
MRIKLYSRLFRGVFYFFPYMCGSGEAVAAIDGRAPSQNQQATK